MELLKRFKEIQGRITEAAARSKRYPSDVQLLAVTKTVKADLIRQAYDAGLRDFGENRVQEALGKMTQLPSDIRWHLIGRLQDNKINKVLGKFILIHSVDSFQLAQDISKRIQKGAQQDVLLEVNTSGEKTKAGVEITVVVEETEKINQLLGLRLRGLMTIGPHTEDQARQREAFRKLKELFEQVKTKGIGGDSFSILSMGMSSDYEAAIEEGSTLVRIGTALFGPRNS